jgi:hypothetical protein
VLGQRTCIDLMWLGGELYIMCIEIINKIVIFGCNMRGMKMWGAMILQERGVPRGNYSWVLIQTHILELLLLLLLCITF